MNEEAFYVGTDTIIAISNLRDSVTDELINDATIAGKLYTIASVEIVSGAVVFSAAGSGAYNGLLPDTALITAGTEYYLEVTVEKDALKLTFRMKRTAKLYIE